MTVPSVARGKTHRFRQNARQPLLIAGMTAALLAPLVVVAVVAPWDQFGTTDHLTIWGGGAVLLALIAACLWAAQRRPVVLAIGPEGLHMPFGWRHPLAWRDIHRIRRKRQRRQFFHEVQWLEVDPAPGVLPDYRLPGPRRLELWWVVRGGIRVPLDGIDADPEAIVASIERYRPVTRVTA